MRIIVWSSDVFSSDLQYILDNQLFLVLQETPKTYSQVKTSELNRWTVPRVQLSQRHRPPARLKIPQNLINVLNYPWRTQINRYMTRSEECRVGTESVRTYSCGWWQAH